MLGGLFDRGGVAEQLGAVDAGGAAVHARLIRPVVTVPVLSSTTVSMVRDDSRAW